MGYGYIIKCEKCHYSSPILHLGRGMFSQEQFLVGSCANCRVLTELSEKDELSKCSACKKKQVVKTPSVTDKQKPGIGFDDLLFGRSVSYQCPKCLQFSAKEENGGIPDVLWD